MPITYQPGTGIKDRAQYALGKATIPAAMVTRMLKGLPATGSIDRYFFTSLAKHGAFLDALEAAQIAPAKAIETFKSLKPLPVAKTGERASRIEMLAEALAPKICQRFGGEDPQEVVAAFLAAVAKPEFKAEAVDIIKAHKAAHGMTPTGHIKTSDRKANPKALRALAEFRKKAAKKK